MFILCAHSACGCNMHGCESEKKYNTLVSCSFCTVLALDVKNALNSSKCNRIKGVLADTVVSNV